MRTIEAKRTRDDKHVAVEDANRSLVECAGIRIEHPGDDIEDDHLERRHPSVDGVREVGDVAVHDQQDAEALRRIYVAQALA